MFYRAVPFRPTLLGFRSISHELCFPRSVRCRSTSGPARTQHDTGISTTLGIENGMPSIPRFLQLPKQRDDLLFRHGICDHRARRLTVREVTMLMFMDAITDKLNWDRKVFHDGIVNKWREETQAVPNTLISEKAFEWCMKELRDKAKEFERDKFIKTLENSSKCVKSDNLICMAFGNDLREAAKPLLEINECHKDWHPNSDGKVLNLVHPSLYPLVGGRSHILTTGQLDLGNCLECLGQGSLAQPGEAIPSRGPGHGLSEWWNQHKLCSTRFQWLPSDVQFVGQEGTEVTITSYINNLHPVAHHKLYENIQELIGKSIPLWNTVLMRGWDPAPGPRIQIQDALCEPSDEPFWFHDMYNHEGDLTPLASQIREYIAQPDNPFYIDRREARRASTLPEDPKDWNIDQVYEAVREVYERTRTIIHPEPDINSYEQWKSRHTTTRLEEEFRKEGLQVIVKISSIELTPDKPEYAGGNWHLEGMLNEGIVATSIYYYDIDNVTESRIRFSQENEVDSVYHGVTYEQDDHEPLSIILGSKDMKDEPAIQEIGNIATRHGRILAFPNTLRHRVEPFSLIDKTKTGHRRYVVMWLVDPGCRIVSTANVPPQQLSWAEGISICDDIKSRLMTLDEAKMYRLELMKERTALNHAVEENFDSYNLCEH